VRWQSVAKSKVSSFDPVPSATTVEPDHSPGVRPVCPRIVFEAGWVMEVEAHIAPATAKGQMRSRKDRPSYCSPEGA
jgi:hypothetical protein